MLECLCCESKGTEPLVLRNLSQPSGGLRQSGVAAWDTTATVPGSNLGRNSAVVPLSNFFIKYAAVQRGV